MTDQTQPEVDTFVPSITFLNWSGDVTITWDEQNKDAILKLVEEKLKQRYHFFIIKPRILSFLGDKKVKLRDAKDLLTAKGLVVPDATAAEFMKSVRDADVAQSLADGTAMPAKAPKSVEHVAVRRATTAMEVLSHQTMAVKPVTGG